MQKETLKTKRYSGVITNSKEQRRIKVVAWANILAQALFPLSVSFTPAIAALSATEQHISQLATQNYILDIGESVDEVASRFGISVEALRKLNSYRTFSKPFTSLSAGDEIDIPRSRSPFSADNQSDEQRAKQLAGYLVSTATALSGDNAGQSAAQLARSSATQKFNDEAQQWLNQFGSARVQLNLNDDFNVDGSAIDLLLPLFDNQQNLLFTQLGARNKDDRNTFNVGVGFRHFQQDWMYGINSFFDNDITGKNRRLGVGAELWTDYLKLSANGYFALTDWHQSRDFIDYNERPANGYDLRLEGYLPFYAQLGGKLMYEQYRGEQVALFGKESRQQNPYALTAGINYTPIPLLTLGTDYRVGKGGKSDTSINLQFNYRLGQSWQSQLDPAAVAAGRTLMGARHSLVERNNNIVLDYQRREFIRLSLQSAQQTATAGETVIVEAKVSSQHALERIEWDSLQLEAAGAVFTPLTLTSASIKLPPYQKEGGTNSYTLSAVAYDSQGNASPRAALALNVLPSRAEITADNMVMMHDNAISNGIDANIVEVTVTDSEGLPMAGEQVTFSASNNARISDGQAAMASASAFSVVTAAANDNQLTMISDAEGKARVEIRSTTAGISQVTASVNSSSQTVDVNFLPDSENLSAEHSTLKAEPALIVADGNAAATISFTLMDANRNPVSGQEVVFSTTLAQTTLSEVVDQGDGSYTAKLTGTLAGSAPIAVQVGGAAFAVAPLSITITGDSANLSSTNSELTTSTNTLVADGKSTATVTLTLKDANGNAVTGLPITFSSSLGQFGAVVETGVGVYSAPLTGTRAGSAEIVAKVAGGSFELSGLTITFTADSDNPSAANSVLTAEPAQLIANGSDEATLTIQLKDANNNPIVGQSVSFESSLLNSSVGTVTDHGDGSYSAMLKGTKAGEAIITAKIAGVALEGSQPKVTFSADSSNLSTTNSTLTSSSAFVIANGAATATLTFTLLDGYSNPVSGQNVSFDSSFADSQLTTVTDQGNGVYTAQLTATKTGSTTVSASVAGTRFASLDIRLIGDVENLDTDLSSLEVSKSSIVANGSDSVLITLKLKDRNDNPLGELPVSFDTDLETTISTVTESSEGVYTATLTGIKAGLATLSVRVAGNVMGIAEQSVTLIADSNNLSKTSSTLTVSQDTLVANDQAAAEITLTLKDANDNPVTGQSVTFSSTLTGTHFEATVEKGEGVYTSKVTGTKAGSAPISANVASWQMTGPSVTFTADSSNLSASYSKLAVSDARIVADGSETSTLSFTLRDGNDNPVTGQSVTFSSDLAVTIGSVTEQADGVYTAQLSGTQIGTATVSAKVAGNVLASETVTLIADINNLDSDKSSLDADVTTIIADNSSAATLTLTLHDGNGNPISGQNITFVSSVANTTFSSVVDNGDGSYTTTLVGKTAGQAKITVKADSTLLAGIETTVTLLADSNNLSSTLSTLSASSTSMVANGSATSVLTFTLKDGNSNPVSGQTVTFSSSLPSATLGTVTDVGDGSYKVTLQAGTVAGSTTITAKVGSTLSKTVVISLNGDKDNLSVALSTLVASPTDISRTDSSDTVKGTNGTSKITLTLKDVNGNLVTGAAVTFTATGASGTTGSVSAGSGATAGQYSATFTMGDISGIASITAKVNSLAFNITAAKVTITKTLKTSPNQLGKVQLPAGYDLIEYTFANANWIGDPLELPAAGVANGNKINIIVDSSFAAVISTANTDVSGSTLSVSQGGRVSFVYSAVSGKWIKQ
ncbi:invasin domain 3-containing protein [Serratia microhaemolytica]|uniref:invasin domain 3-containing protein n=1 Tax=Serratia microhaemolytica TaxID=2675110 RepID=UPI000FDCE9A1|nr:invasin domain 3-containing protein [Serratia microhaemolytica]